ncbi:MAG: 2Fe-2S iron-sulfur cluster-binding protein [Syntrophobacter sp.]
MITLNINGSVVKGLEGSSILDVARSSGISIPTLCHSGALEPSGACRLCIVEVNDGKRNRMVASCLYPIREGIDVYTESERVRNARHWILQMLVDEHPGSEKIREIAGAYGVQESAFRSDDCDDTCIRCGLCVIACKDVAGIRSISFANRGVKKEVTTAHQLPSPECVGCGVCLYVCPTESMERLFAKTRQLAATVEGRQP